ncbi:MAG: GTP-binding protein [Patescibacteria group bacterium]|nr:GTP-binding protein [Patescibacteria group bacterium]
MTKEVTPTERPPVVAVLGHVDHGKSTLLDFIRKSNTVAGEAGGITQSVAAYEVVHQDGKRITFIDTPGHAAFQAIRARGASVADIGVLVVAADDGVKAQTLEALESIKSAGIPFVVAINKIDKTGASVERTQSSLMEKGVYLEKLGGDVPWTAVSAKTGEGVEELLNLILLVAELEGMKGDPSAPAKGYVVEAHRDKRRGIEATLIIKDGTLKSGMAVLAGRSVAPVRIMEDFTGKQLKESSFSTPVSLIGFDELPEAGAEFCS